MEEEGVENQRGVKGREKEGERSRELVIETGRER